MRNEKANETGIAQKIAIHKSYVRLTHGQHCTYEKDKYKTFPFLIDINHFKWRGNFIENSEDYMEVGKKHGLPYFYVAGAVSHYKKHSNFLDYYKKK